MNILITYKGKLTNKVKYNSMYSHNCINYKYNKQ